MLVVSPFMRLKTPSPNAICRLTDENTFAFSRTATTATMKCVTFGHFSRLAADNFVKEF